MADQAQKGRLIAALTELGGAAGNGRLREALQWDASTYDGVKDQLVAEGVVGKGRGRGGSLFLIDSAPAEGDEPAEGGESDADGIDLPEDDDDDEDGDDDAFTLITQEEAAGAPRRQGKKRKVRRNVGEPAQVRSYRHTDMRSNNPEVGMVHPENDPDQPKTGWAYDPHIDPALQFDVGRAGIEALIDEALASGDAERMRDALAELKRLQAPYLNWTGKAERTSFEVDTVSLHVHERVDPATILAQLRKRLKSADAIEGPRQADLFAAPFENLPLRQALDFYKHEKNWSNRLIAGDSLLVMNSLIQKESMAGQVQMIYIDPPYGIKYGSNFQPFTNKRDVKDGADADLTQEPEMIKAFRDTWELGIHSYLTYLRDRLLLARELLHESGSVFVQISDENVHRVREVLDELFGTHNFIAEIAFRTTSSLGGEFIGKSFDYLVWYGKNRQKTKVHRIYRSRDFCDDVGGRYSRCQNVSYARRKLTKSEKKDVATLAVGTRIYRHDNLTSQSGSDTSAFPVHHLGLTFRPMKGFWKSNPIGIDRLNKAWRIAAPTNNSIGYVRFLDDFPYSELSNVWSDTQTGAFTASKEYVVQTNEKVIERCLLMTTDPGDLVLDPTCGSGTTAFVGEKWGRRWITCDTSRVAITLAKQRLMTASFDYFSLRYPHEGLKGGFTYETVPHITLKCIANNPDIDAIYERMHPAIETALGELNAALAKAPPTPFAALQGVRKGKKVDFVKGDALHEWEVPTDWPASWPEAALSPFNAFHIARQAMLSEMDRSIAARAEAETLYDEPEVDKTRLRITGPFSVEAVPSPMVLSLDETRGPAEADASIARTGETSRQALWRNELMKTGIRGKGGAMLRFAEMEAIPGVQYLHASAILADTGERALISFGPEHAALEQRQVELALNEAEKLRPAPKFIVFCAFTFDSEAAKDIDEVVWPGVTLLKAQMNADLLTEDLKKARSSNESFWLMGQPDVEPRKRDDGLWEIEVRGFDYFDPKAGELISGGKSKIAMWALDVDYDQRSLLPHQVFFPMAGAKDGWNRLRKTIRAELDEDLLEQFHGTVSLPFAAGDNKRIAVKIVDDRGIESLKIMALDV